MFCTVCVTMIIVLFSVFDSFASVFIRLFSVSGSRPDVGSSRKNSPGSARSSTAILALFFWPPLSFLIYSFALSSSPTICKTFCILSSLSPFVVSGGIFNCAVYSNILLNLRFSYIMSCCGTKPIIFLSD